MKSPADRPRAAAGPRRSTALRLALPLLLALGACASVPPPADPNLLLDLHADYRIARGVWRLLPDDAPLPDSAPSSLVFSSDEETGAAVAIFRRDHVIHVVFRGTRSGRAGGIDRVHNTMMDLDPIPFAADPRHRAHRGFLKRYLALRGDIWNEIDRLYRLDHPDPVPHRAPILRAYGHSAGAATAVLFGLDAVTRLHRERRTASATTTPTATVRSPVTVVTFGSPRVLNRHAAAWIANAHDAGPIEIIRIHNRGDIIPIIPPALFGYRHPVAATQIGSHGLLPISFTAHHPGYGRELAELGAEAAATRPDPAAWLDDARRLREELSAAENPAQQPTGHPANSAD